MTIANAIAALRPGAQWLLNGNDLTWLDTIQSPPTQAEINAQILRDYALKKQGLLLAGRITVPVGAAVNVVATMDPASLVMLVGAYAQAAAAPSMTFDWVQEDGVGVVLTTSQMAALFKGVTDFVQATFSTLKAVNAAIAAGGIATTDQIDNFTSPAWPVNS